MPPRTGPTGRSASRVRGRGRGAPRRGVGLNGGPACGPTRRAAPSGFAETAYYSMIQHAALPDSCGWENGAISSGASAETRGPGGHTALLRGKPRGRRLMENRGPAKPPRGLSRAPLGGSELGVTEAAGNRKIVLLGNVDSWIRVRTNCGKPANSCPR